MNANVLLFFLSLILTCVSLTLSFSDNRNNILRSIIYAIIALTTMVLYIYQINNNYDKF